MGNSERELRRLWTEQGVTKGRQDALIREIKAKAQPGSRVGPFIIGGSVREPEGEE